MSKTRKTKKDKVRSSARKERAEGFVIKKEWLETGKNTQSAKSDLNPSIKKYLRTDLTKTLILTMLVLALELAIWQYLSRH